MQEVKDLQNITEYSIIDDLDFPEEIYIIEYSNKTHAIGVFDNIHGLACFINENQALFFNERVNLNNPLSFSVIKIKFDDAREIAKSKPEPICALLIFNDLQSLPKIHYIK